MVFSGVAEDEREVMRQMITLLVAKWEELEIQVLFQTCHMISYLHIYMGDEMGAGAPNCTVSNM